MTRVVGNVGCPALKNTHITVIVYVTTLKDGIHQVIVNGYACRNVVLQVAVGHGNVRGRVQSNAVEEAFGFFLPQKTADAFFVTKKRQIRKKDILTLL